jgi:hypothetical protein
MTAAAKVGRAARSLRPSLSKLDLRGQSCEGLAMKTERKRAGPIDDCVPAAAAFFDCLVWARALLTTSPQVTTCPYTVVSKFVTLISRFSVSDALSMLKLAPSRNDGHALVNFKPTQFIGQLAPNAHCAWAE